MPALLDSPTTQDFDDAEILCAADYPAEPIEWLWAGRIPIGKVTLLVGDPGNGKSLVALDIAARVSRGTPWPDEQKSRAESQESRARTSGSPLSTLDSRLPGSVLILSAEDDLRDTIRPRLDAAGADPSRVFILPSIADLRHDLKKLRAALDRTPDCRLIVIDPVNAYVGPGDSHFHTIVRRVFQPLAKLAAEKGLAVLAVSHLRKHDGAAIQRAAGSMGFVAAARAVWTVCQDHTQPGRHLLLPLKNNFVADMRGLAYTIKSTPTVPLKEGRYEGSSAPAISWQTEAVTVKAAEALTPVRKPRGPEAAELKLAMNWLRQELADGPKSAFLISTEGVFCGGFNERTLRRALAELGGETRKQPYHGEWEWSLPEHLTSNEASGGRKSPADVSRRSKSPAPETCPLGENKQVPQPETCPLGENEHIPEPETCPLGEKSHKRRKSGRRRHRPENRQSPPSAPPIKYLPPGGTEWVERPGLPRQPRPHHPGDPNVNPSALGSGHTPTLTEREDQARANQFMEAALIHKLFTGEDLVPDVHAPTVGGSGRPSPGGAP
jgi:putative DNA primase/helicase